MLSKGHRLRGDFAQDPKSESARSPSARRGLRSSVPAWPSVRSTTPSVLRRADAQPFRARDPSSLAQARATARRAAAILVLKEVRAIAGICCSPPLNRLAIVSLRSDRIGKRARTSARSVAACSLSERAYTSIKRFSSTVILAKMPRPSGTRAIPRRRFRSALFGLSGRPA